MVKSKGNCCYPASLQGCCHVEAVISVDERGQMVLPKEARDKANIHAGDKLAVISWEKGGNVSCLTLIKAESLTNMVKDILGPVMEEVFKK
jgi:antitoxin PrlF